jgi:CheY-like chemotaxis protein
VFDLWMPVMDGWEFRRRLLASHPRVPVVVLSALDLPSERLGELRADAVVNKPFDLDTLYEALEQVLGRQG